uniref:uncharacterized protein LOC122604497 n=1 Tax=Erigeron canadensis TaxID=72917 RepID=UPI001CB9CD1E|nr:uncharacterized protein LOC122604497 [Erigeron canadensis]
MQNGNGNSQSHLTIQTNYPVRNEFITNGVRKTVEEIRELPMWTENIDLNTDIPKVECVVLASIRLLEEEHNWFYVAHRPCKKKVKTKAEFLKIADNITGELQNAPSDSLWCDKCMCQATSVIPKFRIQFKVQDATGSTSFMMFDQDVARLLNLSANYIRDRQVQSENPNGFPHELDALVNRMLAFKIVVNSYNVRNKYYVFTVIKVCDDPDIIDELLSLENQPEV